MNVTHPAWACGVVRKYAGVLQNFLSNKFKRCLDKKPYCYFFLPSLFAYSPAEELVLATAAAAILRS
jgi:hypothetical protein